MIEHSMRCARCNAPVGDTHAIPATSGGFHFFNINRYTFMRGDEQRKCTACGAVLLASGIIVKAMHVKRKRAR